MIFNWYENKAKGLTSILNNIIKTGPQQIQIRA